VGFALLPGLKRPVREVNCLPISSADMKNEQRFTPASPVGLHGFEGDSFVFTFIIAF
jgi:hypothetical protein